MKNHSRDNLMSRWPTKEIAEMKAQDQSAEREALPPLPDQYEAAAHIFPCDLLELGTGEKTCEVCSIPVGSEEQIVKLADRYDVRSTVKTYGDEIINFARAVEAAHGVGVRVAPKTVDETRNNAVGNDRASDA